MAILREDVMNFKKELKGLLSFDDSMHLAFDNIREPLGRMSVRLANDYQIKNMTEEELGEKVNIIIDKIINLPFIFI